MIQTDMYHSKPWVPENVSPSVASFVSTRPTFGSQTSSRKPTEASAHNSYSKFAISGEIEKELDDGRLTENKCFRQTSGPAQQWVGGPGVPWDSLICLPRTSAKPKEWIIGCQSQPRSQANHYHTLDCIHDMTIIIISEYRTTQIDNHTQEMATDVRSLVQRHSF